VAPKDNDNALAMIWQTVIENKNTGEDVEREVKRIHEKVTLIADKVDLASKNYASKAFLTIHGVDPNLARAVVVLSLLFFFSAVGAGLYKYAGIEVSTPTVGDAVDLMNSGSDAIIDVVREPVE
jgi:hypothetical protein